MTNGDPQREDVVLSLWHEGLKLLVVTDGEKGCRYFTKVFTFVYIYILYICLYGFVNVNNGKNGNQECKGRVEGFKVKTIDTTGAGDAFVGSLLVSLAKDKSLYQVS